MARTPSTRSPAKGKAPPPGPSLDSPLPPPKPAAVRAQPPRLPPPPESPPARRPNMPPPPSATGGSEERLARGGKVKGRAR
jgi:hypothetical protein